jgi:hypothetical protein
MSMGGHITLNISTYIMLFGESNVKKQANTIGVVNWKLGYDWPDWRRKMEAFQ